MLADQVLADLPPLNQFHWFLLWQLIFHSYSWELIFGRPSVWTDLSSPLNGNFTDSCSDSWYFIPSLRAHIWQTNCWYIYPPSPALNGNYRYLLWEPTFGRPSVGRSTPLSFNGNFTDSCSDSSYFILYSENSYFADQVLADLPPHIKQQLIDSYTESSYLADQMLTDLPYSHVKWQW